MRTAPLCSTDAFPGIASRATASQIAGSATRAWPCARVLRDEKDELRTGVALAGTLATGDEESDLGMGHVMMTPGAYVAFQHASYSGEALISYGRAVGRAGARGQAPIVNLMNESEIQRSPW